MLARSALRCRNLRLSGVAAADRGDAVRAQLQAWEPWPECVYLVAWQQNDQALAFAVDGRWLSGLLKDLDGIATLPVVLWPETLMRVPLADGTRLLRCLDGYEGQSWHGGVLLASRWWKTAPDGLEWTTFLRSLGAAIGSETTAPAVQHVEWLSHPSVPVSNAADDGAPARRRERWMAGASVGILLFFTGAIGHQAWRIGEHEASLQAERDRLEQSSKPVLAARDLALQASNQVQSLARALSSPLPLEVLDHLSSVLPAKGALLREFELTGSGLRVALETQPDLSRSELITRLQSGGWFTQVAEAREPQRANGVVLEMQLAGLAAPSRAAAEAGLKRASDEAAPRPAALPEPSPARP